MKIMLEACSCKITRSTVIFLLLWVAQSALCESLYSETTYRSLASDTKASHIGDSLTVLIVENSKAEATNDTDTLETTGNSFGSNNGSNNESLGVDTNSKYRSGGEVKRTGKLLAKITVTVLEVLPTGELRVKGEQNIQVNDERQAITLSGNIRPSDIDVDNTVDSTRIANAKITYKGDGYISDDEPGVITQFFRWLF